MRSTNARGAREFLLIGDKDDDFPSVLLDFCAKNAVRAASFHAIGAFRRGTIAYWNAETQKYEEIAVDEQVEVVSMTGNLAPSPEGPKLHAHTILGKRDGSTIAGHFVRATIYPTLEIFLTERDATVQRRKDPQTGLWLLDV